MAKSKTEGGAEDAAGGAGEDPKPEAGLKELQGAAAEEGAGGEHPRKQKRNPKQDAGQPEAMPGLVEGRVVHYVLPDGPRRGEHRAAIVSYVHDDRAGLVNLHVLLNGAMDYPAHNHPGNNRLVEKVWFSDKPQAEGAWHWIERG